MRWLPLLLPALALGVGPIRSGGETVKDREGAVRQDRATMENDARWIYNDHARGFAEARRAGKPLLVVLRCVPCLSCAGIDAGVLTEAELAPLLDRFVCVRVINANALDLSRFQFDYDLSFSVLFFNGDGTVYGRYGSWTHQRDPLDKTTAGFRRALEATLAIHQGYPANGAALAGKQGEPLPFKSPLDIPGLAGRYQRELDWQGKVVASCVHCHQIGEALRGWQREQGKGIATEWIYPWPAPETIGITLAADQAARVKDVENGSSASRAGLQADDDLVSLAGQPLVAAADVSWILHRAPEAGTLDAVIRRGGEERRITIDLPSGWRSRADISRRAGTWELRALATGGLLLEELTDAERRENTLAPDGLALRVKHAGEYGRHAAAKKAGFQKGDVIVAVDGVTGRTTESELIGLLLRGHQPGDRVKATVLRDGRRIELELPVQ